MSVRPINAEEVEKLEPLIAAFFAEGHIEAEFDPKYSARTLRSLLAGGSGIAFVAEVDGKLVGLIAGVIHPDMTSGIPCAGEWCWFVAKEYRGLVGLKLLAAYEAEAERRGARKLVMLHLMNEDGEKVAEVLKRRGYIPREQLFMRTLCQPPQVL